MQDRIEDKEIQFSNQIKHDFIFTGNKTLIHILIYNLVINAIKYNRPQGSIVVEDGFNNSQYFISIKDSGIGMNTAQMEKVFNRFARISSDQDGQGLGLAIAESVAVFHHIEIKVTSEINEGSSFTLLFPEV